MKHLVIISGYSGAGKSVALRALEDVGYEVMDNIPLKALASVVESLESEADYLAIGSDIRAHGFTMEQFTAVVEALRSRYGKSFDLVFLSADVDVLLGRFKETRRPHPLTADRPVSDAVQAEITLLKPMKDMAEDVIDTSGLTPRELQRSIQQRFAAEEAPFHVEVISFSYKHGLPRSADLVFDVRFLRNPHYHPDLRPLTGLDAAVGEHIMQDERFEDAFNHISTLVLQTLPWYREEGKRLLTLAFGCTGGKHRSVFLTKRMAECLAEQGVAVTVRHREIRAS